MNPGYIVDMQRSMNDLERRFSISMLKCCIARTYSRCKRTECDDRGKERKHLAKATRVFAGWRMARWNNPSLYTPRCCYKRDIVMSVYRRYTATVRIPQPCIEMHNVSSDS